MKKAGIIGGSGYTGGELIRIILNHPKIKLEFVYSSTRAGSLLSDKHNDLLGVTDIKFTDVINESVDICLLYTSPSPRDATLSRMPSSA